MEKPLKEEYIGERLQGLPIWKVFALVMQPAAISACADAILQINSYLMFASKGSYTPSELKNVSLYERARYFDQFAAIYKSQQPEEKGTVEE